MLKFLLIIAISIYVLSKLGRFFFGMGMSQNRSHQRQGNVSANEKPNTKNKVTIKGGEYIDYEEVK